MLLGVIADDFTGASDIANTIAKGMPPHGGLRTAQYLGIPREHPSPEIEAGVISLKSRSIAVDEAVAQSLAALHWLLDNGCQQIVFKYCSTFDSTKEGNIGPVAEALASAMDVRGVVVCPAFPGAGRTVYMGHLFVRDKLLNESGLQHHPLTPMTDPNIRRWLRYQTTSPVGFVPLPIVMRGVEAISNALAGASETLVVVDATSDDQLAAIGSAVADHKLVSGGSGVAIGLPTNFIRRGLAKGNFQIQIAVNGPGAILAGSCSGATRAQIDKHSVDHPTLPIDVNKVMFGETTANDLVAFFRDHIDRAPLAYSTGVPEDVRMMQEKYGRDAVAQRLDGLFAEAAKRLVEAGFSRLVVAGGETSGAVVSALHLGALAVGQEIDPGVPILHTHGERKIALALKSGNFGSEDFFAKALDRMKRP